MTDIIVIGGGASGMAAAIAAKTENRRLSVAVCEKNDRVGKKLLATGNGRCNLSNISGESEHFHGSFDAAELIGRAVPAEEFFSGICMLTKADEEGRVYPYSNAASTVLNSLRQRMADLGIEEICGFDVADYYKSGNNYIVRSDGGKTLSAARLIIAAGGYAAPVYGTDGAMIRLLREKGYKIARLSPAVAPLKVSPDRLKGLKGVRARCRVTASADGEIVHSELGEIQFNENNLSGICVFNLAYLYADYPDTLSVSVDFAPDIDIDELTAYVSRAAENYYNSDISVLLSGMFSKNLGMYLVKTALDRPLTDRCCDVDRAAAERLARTIKDCRFYVTGSAPWQNAQATLGGIHSSEVNEMLGSRRERGVFFCGEILDTVGDCGGFNLKWAWASGQIAGRACARSITGEE